jgi:hypothetical protein
LEAGDLLRMIIFTERYGQVSIWIELHVCISRSGPRTKVMANPPVGS